MKNITLDLSELIEEGKTDSISGRKFGEGYAKKIELVKNIKQGKTFIIIIDPEKIKAINDSFWKGFFSAAFQELKSKEQVNSHFIFETDNFYTSLIDKNLTILDSIFQQA
ncbi:MAG: hypothetical protein Q8T08_01855 [Ignavibacteria bacterium]|nr:hypothetical protein [Ignavibacteria bacterium]